MATTPDSAGACPNCGNSAASEYCPECGQRQRSYRSSIWRIGWDLLIEVLDVDGRLWRTLRDLFLRPGSLAHAFSADRRASYVAPLRLYLFSSLLFFFLLALVPAAELGTVDAGSEVASEVSLEAEAEAVAQEAEAVAQDADAVSQDAEAVAQEADTVAEPTDIAALFGYLDERDQGRLQSLYEDESNPLARDTITVVATRFEAAKTQQEEPPWWLRHSLPGMVEFLDDPIDFLGRVIENLPIAMFVLLPFYAALLKLLFLNRGRFYAEHLVFALHLHVLAFLMFSVVILLPEEAAQLSDVAGVAAFLWLGIYTWLAMRNYYGGRLLTVGVRFVGLGVAYLALLVPALLTVMAFTFIAL